MKWMDSSMPALSMPRLLFLLIFSWGLLQSPLSWADNFSVSQAEITQSELGGTLTAQIQYPLNERVKEALINSVPITFYQDFKVVDHVPILGEYWQWRLTRWELRQTFVIRYHALSEQYVLKQEGSDQQQSFLHLADALATMGQIPSLKIPYDPDSDTSRLALYIKSGIDVNALPTPMRPGALLSDKWQLDSPWRVVPWD
jgi:hypothetical protein